MKKLFVIASICVASMGAKAQSTEAQQLLLNWEKLTQFKKILQNENPFFEWLAFNLTLK
jgi:hypothetical protein